MSKSIKTLLAVGLVAFVAACAQQDEPVEIEIVDEPTYEKF